MTISIILVIDFHTCACDIESDIKVLIIKIKVKVLFIEFPVRSDKGIVVSVSIQFLYRN